jgi:hypothetical protein
MKAGERIAILNELWKVVTLQRNLTAMVNNKWRFLKSWGISRRHHGLIYTNMVIHADWMIWVDPHDLENDAHFLMEHMG